MKVEIIDSEINVSPDTTVSNGYGIIDMIYYSPTKEDEKLELRNVYAKSSTSKATKYKVDKDGCYRILHWIIPNETWLNSYKTSTSVTYPHVYYIKTTSNGSVQLYEYHSDSADTLIPISGNILKEVDPSETNIGVYDTYTFSILNLHKCYVSLSEQILKTCYTDCESEEYSLNSLRGKRDFIWSAINVIKYYINFAQFFQAQKLLETISKCGGLCDLNENSHESSCGCGRTS